MLERLNPVWIAHSEGVGQVVDACAAAGRFALDTEADSLHSYFHKVCLVQVSAGDRHFLLDPLELDREALGPLLELLADPAVPVLMHGADYDVRVLDRDLGARIGGLQDTQIMAQLLGEARTGLAALLERDVGVELDKRYQRADWGQRPLPPQLLAYAAADTAFLEALVGRLRPRLEALGRWGWAEEEFARLEAVRFVPPEPDPLAFERLRGARALKGPARDRLFALYDWRERRAQQLDVPPFRIMPNGPLVAVAAKPPKDAAEVAKVDGLGPRFVRRWGREVLEQLAQPGEAPPRVRRRGNGPPSAELKARVKALLVARDRVAGDLGLDSGLVCARAVAEAVAGCETRPPSREDLARCGLVGWRLGLLAEPFLEVLANDGAAG